MFKKYFLECNINVTDKWQRYARKIVDTYKKDCEITESKPVPILKINDYPEILEPLENYKKYLSGHFRILIIIFLAKYCFQMKRTKLKYVFNGFENLIVKLICS